MSCKEIVSYYSYIVYCKLCSSCRTSSLDINIETIIHVSKVHLIISDGECLLHYVIVYPAINVNHATVHHELFEDRILGVVQEVIKLVTKHYRLKLDTCKCHVTSIGTYSGNRGLELSSRDVTSLLSVS